MKIKQREPEISVKVCVTVLITAKMLICPLRRGHWVNSRAIDSNAKTGPAFTFAICRENSDAMRELTGISRPAYTVFDDLQITLSTL